MKQSDLGKSLDPNTQPPLIKAKPLPATEREERLRERKERYPLVDERLGG
jgi:hypothetical protein